MLIIWKSFLFTQRCLFDIISPGTRAPPLSQGRYSAEWMRGSLFGQPYIDRSLNGFCFFPVAKGLVTTILAHIAWCSVPVFL